ncbi:MAG: hypothetical protein COA68_03755 [Oceanobacter sp.]|nr:MAG: hypothetical protein COA68_03755 [Oceanobacter sp.]
MNALNEVKSIRSRIILFVFYFNIVSLAVYSLPMSVFSDALPYLSIAAVANLSLLLILPLLRYSYTLVLVSLSFLVIFIVISAISQATAGIIDSEFLRLMVVVFGMAVIFREFGSKARLIAISRIMVTTFFILVLLQAISILVFEEEFFSINYSSSISFRGDISKFRFSPLNGDPNYFSYTLLPFLIAVTFSYLFFGKRKTDLILVGAGVIVLLLAMSRGVILAYFGVILYLYTYRIAKRLVKPLELFFLVIACIICLLGVIKVLDSRSDNLSSSTSQRVEILKSQVELISEAPLLGSGYSSSKVEVDGQQFGAHNLFIEVAASYGLFFMACFILLLMLLFFYGGAFQRALLIGFLLASSFLGLIIYMPMWLFLSFCMFREVRDD